jgi:exopolyphosphatase/guanosine-5'-triphosphate,3'-diphosphate pyrophosphatase
VGGPSDITPRWEWRIFDDRLEGMESAYGLGSPERVQTSEETYLLSATGTDAVKVRDELMDVKHLVQVDDDGLEQWTPVMKAEFPLAGDEVDAVLRALEADRPAGASRPAYSWQQVLDEIVGQSRDLRAVDVHKVRNRYTINGCQAEVTEVRAGETVTRTFAIESEDPALVVEALRDGGLAGLPNVCFARGLKTLVRFGVERYAVIDVGTNSVKFHVAERDRDGHWHTIEDRAEVTRLGDGLQETGRLNPEPVERTAAAVAAMTAEARSHGVPAIAAVGTAGLRMAPNSADFLAAVRARCGVTVEIISGEEESRLAYLAAVAGLGRADGSRVVFDTGGGSSQFTFGTADEVEERFSVDVGAVRFTEQYGLDRPVSAEVVADALDAIASDLTRLDGRPVPDTVVAMGGATTNLAAVKHGLAAYDPDVVQGTVLDLAEIDRQIELYRARGADERRQVVGLQPQRADIILAGACIVRTVLGRLGCNELTVSDRGLRHGVLMERFGTRNGAAV